MVTSDPSPAFNVLSPPSRALPLFPEHSSVQLKPSVITPTHTVYSTRLQLQVKLAGLRATVFEMLLKKTCKY